MALGATGFCLLRANGRHSDIFGDNLTIGIAISLAIVAIVNEYGKDLSLIHIEMCIRDRWITASSRL